MLAPPVALWDAPRGNAQWEGRRVEESPHVGVIVSVEEYKEECVIACVNFSYFTWDHSRLHGSFSLCVWGSLPWSLVSVAVTTKQQLCNHILLSGTLSIPGREIRRAAFSHASDKFLDNYYYCMYCCEICYFFRILLTLMIPGCNLWLKKRGMWTV